MAVQPLQKTERIHARNRAMLLELSNQYVYVERRLRQPTRRLGAARVGEIPFSVQIALAQFRRDLSAETWVLVAQPFQEQRNSPHEQSEPGL